MRYNPDGTLDTTFGESGIAVYVCPGSSETVDRIALAVDGRIVAAGYTSGTTHDYDALLLRWNADGRLDDTFGESGVFIYNGPANGYDAFYDVGIQPDGKIVAAGETYQGEIANGQDYDILIFRLNDDGTPDTSFGSGGVVTYDGPAHSSDYSQGLVLTPEGKIVVIGAVTDGEQDSTFVARYTASGVLDPSFGTGGVFVSDLSLQDTSDYANAVALTRDGKVLIVGTYTDETKVNLYLLQLNDNGTPDTSFGDDGIIRQEAPEDYDHVYFSGLKVSSGGKILIAGSLFISGTGTDVIAERFDAQGSPDATFGIDGAVVLDSATSGYDTAADVAIQPDGKIVLTGALDSSFFVIRLIGSGRGEIFGDWEVDVPDVLLLLRMASSLPVTVGGALWAAPYPAELAGRADVNLDGAIDVFDVVFCFRMALQLPVTIDGLTYEYPYPGL
jgi:uncharacterized delta-60 repeat protein